MSSTKSCAQSSRQGANHAVPRTTRRSQPRDWSRDRRRGRKKDRKATYRTGHDGSVRVTASGDENLGTFSDDAPRGGDAQPSGGRRGDASGHLRRSSDHLIPAVSVVIRKNYFAVAGGALESWRISSLGCEKNPLPLFADEHLLSATGRRVHDRSARGPRKRGRAED